MIALETVFTDDLNMTAAAVAGDMPQRVRAALDAGADMALVCNNPQAVGATLVDLAGFANPAAHGRLVALRGRAPRAPAQELRDWPDWRKASAQLAAARGRPSLDLHG